MAPYQNYPTECYPDLRRLYHAVAERYGDKPLFLQKQGVSYTSYSYRRFEREVDALGTALFARGLDGGCILLLGENCYEWALSYMAVICGVGTVVPVDAGTDADTLASLAAHCEAVAVIHSKKSSAALKKLSPSVQKISFDALREWIEEGALHLEGGDRSFLDAPLDPHAMSALLFTSGTHDTPKGVMLSHRNLCFNLSEMCKMIYIDEKDTFLSILPLHHIYECACGFLCPLSRGATVAFGDGLRHLTHDMRWARPTVMLCVPLLIETMHHKLQLNIRKLGMEKQISLAVRASNAIAHEPLRMQAKRRLFPEIHKSFGGRLRMLIVGGASTDPAAIRGLRELGIAVLQGYGLTECAPIVALNRDTFYNDRAAGLATPDTLLDIYDTQDDGTGEIRCKGDHVMLGYFRDPKRTAEVIRNGWFYTGDLGHLDPDGFLFITGRKKNMIVNRDGKHIYPEELETLLCDTPFVKEAVVVGLVPPGKRSPRLIAVIHPDYARMERTYGKRFTRAQLGLELRKAVAQVNATVAPYKRLRDFLIRTEPFPKNTSHKIKRQGIDEEALREYSEKIKNLT
ncbi:MAG: AMP-binding protein [Clostridia bacterium]|nr:AMP-binding protein [Clostridia bacterium]